MKIGRYTVPEIRKSLVALLTAVISIAVTIPTIFSDYLSETAGLWIANGILLLTAVAVFLVRNAQAIDAIGLGRPEDSGAPPIE